MTNEHISFFSLHFIAPGTLLAYSYFTAYACNGEGARYKTAISTAGTMCCPITGGACADSCTSASTWSKAALSCALNGMRLCSKDELLSQVCCGQGDTTCDASAVWTLTVRGGKVSILLSRCLHDALKSSIII